MITYLYRDSYKVFQEVLMYEFLSSWRLISHKLLRQSRPVYNKVKSARNLKASSDTPQLIVLKQSAAVDREPPMKTIDHIGVQIKCMEWFERLPCRQ